MKPTISDELLAAAAELRKRAERLDDRTWRSSNDSRSFDANGKCIQAKEARQTADLMERAAQENAELRQRIERVREALAHESREHHADAPCTDLCIEGLRSKVEVAIAGGQPMNFTDAEIIERLRNAVDSLSETGARFIQENTDLRRDVASLQSRLSDAYAKIRLLQRDSNSQPWWRK